MYAYESDGIDVLLCSFSNPFVGSNAVNVTLTGSRAPTLSCGAVIGSGNHAAANFVLFDTGVFAIGDIVSLICLGSVPGARYLDGRTADGTVGLAPNADAVHGREVADVRWRTLFRKHNGKPTKIKMIKIVLRLPTNRRPQMKELKTGFLLLLVCTTLYIQIDPRIWNNISQLLARLMIGTN